MEAAVSASCNSVGTWYTLFVKTDRKEFAGNQFITKSPELRFWAKVKKMGESECWPWLAAVNKASGYGAFSIGTKYLSAHVYSFELNGGVIPDGYTLDHLCHTRDRECPGGLCIHRSCVNPLHLEPVPRGINTLRGKTITAENKLKTHCPKGHEYNEANTIHEKRGSGSVRVCRTCHNAKQRKSAARRRLEAKS